MKLKLKLKPATFKGKHKDDVLAQMMDYLGVFDREDGLVRYNVNTMQYDYVVYTCHKVNKKVVRGERTTKEFNGKTVQTTSSRTLHQPHWIVSAYIVPSCMCDGSMGTLFSQELNHFNVYSV